MNEPSSSTAASPIVTTIRDALADEFAAALAAAIDPACEWLDTELARSQERDKWKPLREAKQFLAAFKKDLVSMAAVKVRERFDAKRNPGGDKLSKTAMFSLDSLKLVEDAEMREEIAIGNSAKRLKEKSADELVALTRRLALEMGVFDLPDDRNPAFPRIFCRAVMESLKELGCDSATSLAALDAFDTQLPRIARSVYAAVNRQLAGGAQRAAPTEPGAEVSALRSASSKSGSAGELLRRLLAAPQIPAEPRLPDALAPQGAEGMVTVRIRPELLESLRRLECRSHDGDGGAAIAPHNIVRDAVVETSAGMSAADRTIADIVAAMFDRLFADPRLPATLKAQLERLQKPVFEAAAQDAAFFDAPEHPVRRLIDCVCEFGLAGADKLQDGGDAVEAIARVIDEMLAKLPDEAALPWACERLEALFAQNEERVAGHDGSLDAARQAEAADLALQAASIEVLERLAGHPDARELAAFLQRSWKSVLIKDYVEHGPSGESWKQDLRTLDDMMLSLKPQSSKEELEHMVKMLPSLIARLKQGFARIGLEQAKIDAFLGMLQALHEQRLHRSGSQSFEDRLTDLAVEPPAREPEAETTQLASSGADGDAGVARGTWLELVGPGGARRRCRIMWVAANNSLCLLKDYEAKASFAMALAELRARLADGGAFIIEGIGVARDAVESAIGDVARQRGAA